MVFGILDLRVCTLFIFFTFVHAMKATSEGRCDLYGKQMVNKYQPNQLVSETADGDSLSLQRLYEIIKSDRDEFQSKQSTRSALTVCRPA